MVLQKGNRVDADTGFVVLMVVLIGVGVIVYFIPSFVAEFRGHKNKTAILVLNLFLGWLLIGWVAALVWAMLSQDRPMRRRISNPPSFDPPQPFLIYSCPHCRQQVNVSPSFLGHVVACGSCGRHFTATPTAPPARQ